VSGRGALLATPARTKYMPRFYLGVTATNEILTTITGAAQAIKIAGSGLK
jgi:hypothetical protein